MGFAGGYGYAKDGSVDSGYEVYSEYLYTNLNGQIAKIASDGSYELLS